MNGLPNNPSSDRPKRIAVIGSGISGLSAAWLLAGRHEVTLFEADNRLGGHSNTVQAYGFPVDTGFIVHNRATYPNLVALFDHLGVATRPTEMSFAVSMDGGRLEYSGSGLAGLFAQRRNIASSRFWAMLTDLLRFYRSAPRDLPRLGDISLAAYLDQNGYGEAFREDHLFPMAAAIWSTPTAQIGTYPAASFIRFCANHGLLKLVGRPVWRTVEGGSRAYVERLRQHFRGQVATGHRVVQVEPRPRGVRVRTGEGGEQMFDDVVLATHADQALAMIAAPTVEEARLLGAFGYSRNEAVLHGDDRHMPQNRAAWAAWNYLSEGRGPSRKLSVTYWMNALQGLPPQFPLFVTLNPLAPPNPSTVVSRHVYEHPVFDAGAMAAQRELWRLQGVRNLWFCGAYFGAGFHEDGLQAGLAVAEAISGVRRPWTVAEESGRIHLGPSAAFTPLKVAA
ncbi:NAD(P)/FAD-dependent oxidoreductase [Ancylobacter lacus]|uniref:NAD(P)/FAD-dependent oxidoreductase n=1 Tax=Ancylobacter lacus TaxID=2579970 RepID=UPI001BCD442B|nr:NAD(P)/FAD-dependent oxidoreductase [Ancylobacter lacus]MBS7539504.1 NAD(P)/FAD-dependent oxidoreductase [Ancylobacter lacus]